MKRLTTISNAVGTGLIATAVITGSLSIPAYASGWNLPAGMALSGMNILLSLTNAAYQRLNQLFAVKQEKHYSTKLLVQTISDSIIRQQYQTAYFMPDTHLFKPLKILHLLNHLTCCIAGFLHQCIYTFKHIPQDGSFYLVCIQSQPLILLLRCYTRRMEHLDHQNLS